MSLADKKTIHDLYCLMRKIVSECRHIRNGYIRGVMLVFLLGLPLIANGKESTTTTGEKNPEVHQTTEGDSDSTFSGFMNWAQRFGNRVGENISEAASKTASAIKNGTSDNKQKTQSEDNP
jgi:hypothetical protein